MKFRRAEPSNVGETFDCSIKSLIFQNDVEFGWFRKFLRVDGLVLRFMMLECWWFEMLEGLGVDKYLLHTKIFAISTFQGKLKQCILLVFLRFYSTCNSFHLYVYPNTNIITLLITLGNVLISGKNRKLFISTYENRNKLTQYICIILLVRLPEKAWNYKNCSGYTCKISSFAIH